MLDMPSNRIPPLLSEGFTIFRFTNPKKIIQRLYFFFRKLFNPIYLLLKLWLYIKIYHLLPPNCVCRCEFTLLCYQLVNCVYHRDRVSRPDAFLYPQTSSGFIPFITIPPSEFSQLDVQSGSTHKAPLNLKVTDIERNTRAKGDRPLIRQVFRNRS